jgi:Tol biopolymer transport system component
VVCATATGFSPAQTARAHHGGSTTNLYEVAGGSGLRQLTANINSDEDALAYAPSPSPDGRLLAFAQTSCHQCDSRIRVASTARLPVGWLGRFVAVGFKPRWSPDGRRLAFVGTDGHIYTIRPDGKGRRLVVADGLAADTPSWSPDGRRIAFALQETARLWRIAVVGADGGPVRVLTHGTAPCVDPAWSSTGAIAFTCQRGTGRWRLMTMGEAGGDVRTLGSAATSDSAPAWSHDGRRIAFVRELGTTTAVFVMPASGGKPRRVSPSAMAALQPVWDERGRLLFVGRLADSTR